MYVFFVCNSHVKVRWTVYIVRMGERIVGANSAAWRSRVWRCVASARRLGVAVAEPVGRHQLLSALWTLPMKLPPSPAPTATTGCWAGSGRCPRAGSTSLASRGPAWTPRHVFFALGNNKAWFSVLPCCETPRHVQRERSARSSAPALASDVVCCGAAETPECPRNVCANAAHVWLHARNPRPAVHKTPLKCPPTHPPTHLTPHSPWVSRSRTSTTCPSGPTPPSAA